MEKLRAALAKGDETNAEIIVHSLKGIASMMNENDLAQAALAIELTIKITTVLDSLNSTPQ
jgi:HPt (histidine-containing phosphotransfer) domain-containing protein